jgi:hypothetical protein
VATQAWWIEKIKEDPIYQYTEEWAKHSEYQVARWKILAELDNKVVGTSILRGAPGFGQAYPPKIEVKPFWFKPLIGADFKFLNFGPGWKQPSLWACQLVKRQTIGTSTPQLKTSRKEPSSNLASSRKSSLLSLMIT